MWGSVFDILRVVERVKWSTCSVQVIGYSQVSNQINFLVRSPYTAMEFAQTLNDALKYFVWV